MHLRVVPLTTITFTQEKTTMNTRPIKLATVLLTVMLFTSALAFGQQNGSSGEVLTNENVITMVKAGLPASIIVNKIRTSKTNFNTSTDQLIQLQQTRVPSEIINAMVEASTATSTASSRTGAGDASRTDPNDPLSSHEAGIYLYEEIDGKKKMTQLEPSVSKQTKTGGIFASAMTYGIAKIKFKAALAGKNAPLQINTTRPVFYFYFEVKNSGLSSNSYYATSPSEFALVQFNTKSNTREITVSQANAFGAQSGTMDKSARGFKLEKLGPGVYKVTPQEDLTEGEYGFYNGAGVGPSGGAKIFDFGIRIPR
jgi:hypothetical protein